MNKFFSKIVAVVGAVFKEEAVTGEWQPIETAPKLKGKGGRPYRIMVTRSPCTGQIPINVVWWGRTPEGRRWVVTGDTPLRYEPTHWRELPEGP